MSMFQTALEPRAPFRHAWTQLFVLSVLSLFIEIMLIRHLASEIRIFAYFKNLTLVGAFLGLGYGYLFKPRVNLLVSLMAITLLGLLTHPETGFSEISTRLNMEDMNTWEPGAAGSVAWNLAVGVLMLLTIFFLIIAAMVPVGQALSRIFDESQNRIADYSVNVAASLLGIWLFAGLSFVWTPPVYWYVGVYFMSLVVWRWDLRSVAKIGCAMAATAATLVSAGSGPGPKSFWSPYQLITFEKLTMTFWDGEKQTATDYECYGIGTNKTFFLNLLDLSREARDKWQAQISPPSDNVCEYYDLPYAMSERLDHVLVLGAGGGNDVAAALRAGAKKVTAVEIDPVIIRLGTEFHPERPYDDPRVTVVNDDARNFLRTTLEKFDLIVLGLLDSHALTSAFTNTNLDSYMYTSESIADMHSRLAADGVVSLSFFIPAPWMGAKIETMLATEFGAPPEIVSFQLSAATRSGTTFLAGANRARLAAKVDAYLGRWPAIGEATQGWRSLFRASHAVPPNDDWPYLYVRERSIPKLHLLVSALLAAIFLGIYGVSFGKPRRSDLHFAFLGAGFLLLEVAVISRFARFWGSTWLVSSVVISLILLAILAANVLYLKLPRKIGYGPLYAALIVALVGVYVVPLASNATVVLYMVPFTLAGYLFARSFDEAAAAGRALGYNLVGALVGGLAESLSFVTGLSTLTLVAIGFYTLSAVARKPA